MYKIIELLFTFFTHFIRLLNWWGGANIQKKKNIFPVTWNLQ